jgi:tetratricopeptide (TPR) repeat protein
VSLETTEHVEHSLAGRCVALIGKLAGMSRREIQQLVQEHGGQLVSSIDAGTHLVVVNDDVQDFASLIEEDDSFDEALLAEWRDGRLELVRESEFWARLGLVDAGHEVQRLYTPAMLSELVNVPVQAIRHWQRRGRLVATRMVGRLPYFDFEEVRVARRLAELLSAGCTLSVIDRKLDELARLQPQLPRPLADADVVILGSRLYVRRGESITEPTGQLLIDFDVAATQAAEVNDDSRTTLTFEQPTGQAERSAATGSSSSAKSDELRSLALDFDESGEPERAIEVYRAILMSGKFTAEDHFCLAELLYRSGDLAAARERYYAAIELDEDYVEARANLGCVLAEQGELPLAEAAFQGALRYHPGFADAHFHLARLLDAMNQPREASRHWQEFLALAPASPWAEEAHDRIRGSRISGIVQPSQVEHA